MKEIRYSDLRFDDHGHVVTVKKSRAGGTARPTALSDLDV